MNALLIIGCDETVDEAFDIASADLQEQYSAIRTLKLKSKDYFPRDYSLLDSFDRHTHTCCVVGNEFYINQVRGEIFAIIEAKGYCLTNIISRQAFVSPQATLGESNLIWPGAYIGAGTTIGSGCVIRSGTQIYPRCKLGNFITLEPHCVLRESSIIEDYSTLCAHTYLMRTSHVAASVYINKPGQYFGRLEANTFISPFFENDIQIIG